MMAEIFNEWQPDLAEYGIADYLRCVAMCVQELGLSRADYVAESAKRGFNANTAGTCWAFVRRQ